MIHLNDDLKETARISNTLILILLFCLSSCSNETNPLPNNFTYSITNKYPHDALAFTQGLVWDNHTVYEGTGKLGRSSLRRVDLQTGRVEQQVDCAKDIYGEGITVFQDKIFQLTWKNKIVFVYNKHDLSLFTSHPYPRYGWGITHDNQNLIVSDGTSTLYFLDPVTLAEKRRITVHDNDENIKYLNELEYINGKVYANIYRSDRIAMINPNNGVIAGWIDLSGLRDQFGEQFSLDDKDAVLNGIMYDKDRDRLFVTGKFWPTLFEIRLVLAGVP